jgi:PAS domain S-box-containing protein
MIRQDEDDALRLLLEGTASETGPAFFRALVDSLVKALGTYGAWVTEYVPATNSLRGLAFFMGGEWIDGWEREITGTPCEAVIREERLVHFPDRVVDLFPDVGDLEEGKPAVSYLGVPLKDLDGRILGHLAVLDSEPMPAEPRAIALFRIFADRAAAELRRMRREESLREREEKLSRLVEGAMDGIVELDRELRITSINAAAERIFGCRTREVRGGEFAALLALGSARRLGELVAELDARPEGERRRWIPPGLEGRTSAGATFTIEGTLSRYEMEGASFHVLVLRNADERLAAERRIQALASQTRYLREELAAAEGFGEILGRSEALAEVLRDVAQVAATDASVLILGETGTGKELVARAIHQRSRRSEGPLVRLNCGALPAELVESELFGHEPGAFTGATQRRVGRFALADGGTLFLDEVGELSKDLQVKLLRVLQEGEFEPVGSSKTVKVDVRVISATNRDLKAMVAEGAFREDLYYRLEVFPIRLPALRERGDDVVLLAEAFASRFARETGRELAPLSADCRRRLRAYDWPGNVRELQNVIERGAITSRDGRLNLDRALPAGTLGASDGAGGTSTGAGEARDAGVRTAAELEALERENCLRALQAVGWKIAGAGGAAELLGVKPSTLKSRMKALGLARPS